MIRKTVVTEIRQANEDDRTLEFTLSTGAVDRDRDTLDPSGWDLRSYGKNPVVLFAHSYGSLPIARTKEIGVDGGKLQAVAEFVPPELYAFGDAVYQLIRAGFLNAVSVGFAPLKWDRNEDRGGVDFHKQELLEWSIVPVPSNPEALVVARSKGYGREVDQLRRVCSGQECVEVPDSIWRALGGQEVRGGLDPDTSDLDELLGMDPSEFGGLIRSTLADILDQRCDNFLTAITGRLPD